MRGPESQSQKERFKINRQWSKGEKQVNRINQRDRSILNF